MAWYQFKVQFEEEKKEILNAFLLDLGADAILDNGDHFVFYKEDAEDLKALAEQISHLPGAINNVSYEECEDKNWNAEWEANYDPIAVADICYIRAEFHKPHPDYVNEIVIRPEMAFGTGHHETTYMMIQLMDTLDFGDKEVFDYGCGTGILSVFAMLKNAASLFGNDIEAPAIENSFVHCKINQLNETKMDFKVGDIDLVRGRKFDIILANINRRVLLETCDQIHHAMKPEGILLMSGILEADQDLVISKYESKFSLKKKIQKGEWMCFSWLAKT